MAEAEARMAVGDDPQEQDGRDREGTQCVVDLELLGGGGGENQGLEKAGEVRGKSTGCRPTATAPKRTIN